MEERKETAVKPRRKKKKLKKLPVQNFAKPPDFKKKLKLKGKRLRKNKHTIKQLMNIY